MLMPIKRYFRLAELAERWGVQMSDLACYILQGELEASVLTIALSAEIGRFEETPDGILAVPEETITLIGPQPVIGSDLRAVLHGGVRRLTRFKPRSADTYLTIEDSDALRISLSDVVVTRAERDRFEIANGLAFDEPPAQTRTVAGFVQRSNYAEVIFNGDRFLFGMLQARVVRQLHEAAGTTDPWRTGKLLLVNAGSGSDRMVDLFKSKPTWRSLIASDGRGSYRLNLPDPSLARTTQRVFRRLRLVHSA